MTVIDLNCDLGESFGPYKLGCDERILDFVTSANIACGFHAGDPTTIRKTVKMALERNVGIGAHPGLQDLAGFGRREMHLSRQEAYDIVVYQIGALSAFVKAEGGKLQHVKPHGALYHMAGRNPALAGAIAEAIYKIDPEMILFGLAGSELIKAGEKIGLQTASEVFLDRTYQMDGSLTPRNEKDALIKEVQTALKQAVRMIKEGKVLSLQGREIPITAHTLCIHGDSEQALAFAQSITAALKDSGIEKRKISEWMQLKNRTKKG